MNVFSENKLLTFVCSKNCMQFKAFNFTFLCTFSCFFLHDLQLLITIFYTNEAAFQKSSGILTVIMKFAIQYDYK